MNATEIAARRNAAINEARAITDNASNAGRGMTSSEEAQFNSAMSRASAARLEAEELDAGRPRQRLTHPDQPGDGGGFQASPSSGNRSGWSFDGRPSYVKPAHGSTSNFTGPDAAERCFDVGNFVLALAGNPVATRRCAERGLETRAANEGTNTAGGFLVPVPVADSVIRLVEEYGVARSYMGNWPMNSDVLKVPRRTSGITSYYVGESSSGTQSDAVFDQIGLTARKLMCLAKISSELNEDAVLSIGNFVAGEFAHSIAKAEDDAGFLGDGSGTYGGILGLKEAFNATHGAIVTAGQVVGTGNLASECTLSDFADCAALIPEYADGANTRWYMTRKSFGAAVDVAAAAGGSTMQMILDGSRTRRLFGYDVVLVPSMVNPGTTDYSEPLAYFGDLSMAAAFGDRRKITITASDSALNSFEQDELALRATSRYDINVHDIGTTTVAGPIVALVGKGS